MKLAQTCLACVVTVMALSALRADEHLPYEQKQDVVYAEAHGTGLLMDVFTPVGKRNGLGIVDIASGSWFSDRNKIRDHARAQVYTIFCSRGYVVFAVRPGSKTRYTAADMDGNVKSAIRYVKALADDYKIDAVRLGLMGGSAGGHLALLAALTPEPGKAAAKSAIDRLDTSVRAVGVFFPPTDFLDWDGDTTIRTNVIGPLLFVGGVGRRSQDEIREAATAVSPLHRVNKATPPFLVIHGDADKVVPLSQSKKFVDAITKAGGSAELVVKAGGGHPWLTIAQEVKVMADWFDKQLAGEASSGGPARVETASGVVEGTRGPNGVRIFKGIPFAEPPVGGLRWKAPQPVKRWQGVKAANAFAAAPIQNRGMGGMMGIPDNYSEDCLYLNVWTPAKAADDRLPVMVWIYGGAFAVGATSAPIYDGTHLAEKGVVVVSAAYRVGPLGFLAHPELTSDGGGSSGNYGLRDQIAGLEWVRDNIAAFGGDPQRVTIFGESAGGISVSMLAASPLAKGLFQRAISQSGGSFAPPRFAREGGHNVPPLKIAEAEGERYLKGLGAKDIAAARAMPAADLLKGGTRFWPVFDGQVLLGDQYELYQAGRFNDTPVLIGTNSDEGAMFLRPGATIDGFVAQIRNGYGERADAILAAYPHATAAQAVKSSKDIFRDSVFAWPSWAWARLQSEKGKGKAYVYYFDHRTPRAPEGATHGAEIAYVFGNLRTMGRTPRPEDEAMSELMRSYWANFARTGDPNGPGVSEWPRFTVAKQQVMQFDASPGPEPVPNLRQLEALDAYYAWRREQVRKNSPH
jgi:para-nitrobenzyl esterase